MKRIGLLGGSFDPVHLAHVALALAALRSLDLKQVQLLPAANPWQREPLKAAPQHRLRMLELATADHPDLAVNDMEIARGGPTYTIDTIRALPPAAYVWLLGTDQLANFCSWREWQEIAARVDLAVATRPGTPLRAPQELERYLAARNRAVEALPFTPMDVSASDIRERLARGDSTGGLLHPDVAAYIATHGLYR
ncbi:nicotinate (nicotinamide) nucleotide adenylyltransferase [Bordetella sp. 2513F-2]